MPLAFVNPGTPLEGASTQDYVYWKQKRVLSLGTACSVAIIVNNYEHYQSIQLDNGVSAIAFNRRDAALAVAYSKFIAVYLPDEQWHWKHHITYKVPDESCIKSLSWGYNLDLLVCTNVNLSILNFSDEEVRVLWSLDSASGIPFVGSSLSPDACYIASIENDNPLAKVWLRSSPQGTVTSLYDYSYLPHPGPIRFFSWSRPLHPDSSSSFPFFCTIGFDQVLRIWQTGSRFGSQLMHLSCFLSLKEFTEENSAPFCFFLERDDFTAALAHAISRYSGNLPDDPVLPKLVALANSHPQLFFIFSHTKVHVFSFLMDESHLTTVNLVRSVPVKFPRNALPPRGFIQVYRTIKEEIYDYKFLIHFQDHANEYAFKLSDIFSDEEFALVTTQMFYGHNVPIKALVRTSNGHGIASCDNQRVCMFQSYISCDSRSSLVQRSKLRLQENDFVLPLHAGEYAAVINNSTIKLWHCDNAFAPLLLCSCSKVPNSEIITFFILPVQKNRISVLCALTKGGHAWFYNVLLEASQSSKLEFLDRVAFAPKINTASAVDVMGWSSTLSLSSLESFEREVFVSISDDGLLQTWIAKVIEPFKASISEFSRLQTNIKSSSMVKGSTSRKVAVVSDNRLRLSIYDTRSSLFTSNEEFTNVFNDYGPIIDLDWTSTPNSHSILAVGFQHEVILLCQNRRSYISDAPCWVPIRRYSLSMYTNMLISDSSWLDNGTLVTAAGNNLFFFKNKIPNNKSLLFPASLKRSANNIFDLAYQLNGILPVFHPQFLQQLLLKNQEFLIRKILLLFYICLKNDYPMHFLLNMDCSDFYEHNDEKLMEKFFEVLTTYANEIPVEADSFGEKPSVSEDVTTYMNAFMTHLCLLLKNKKVGTLTRSSQFYLLNVIEAFDKAYHLRESLDLNGRRFCIMLNQYVLNKYQRRSNRLPTRDILWGFYSTNKSVLLDYTVKVHGKTLLWPVVEEYGLPFWLNQQALINVFGELSRNHYINNGERDPEKVSLYHVALGKVAVLRSLWSLASWHKESGPTVKFLSNDFTQKRWKVAASKNAFALLSKHRYFYAAAFFLLADSPYDAAKVCIRNLRCLSLAVAVVRVYEGDGKTCLKRIIEEFVLPSAAYHNDRWLTNWGFAMINEKMKSVQSLLVPVRSLIEVDNDLIESFGIIGDYPLETETTEENHDKTKNEYTSDDPALILLYDFLRSDLLRKDQILEYRFVLNSARVYNEMGCDLIALDLLRNWKFEFPSSLPALKSAKEEATGKEEPYAVLSENKNTTIMGQEIKPAPTEIPEFDESFFF
ncbi:RAVE complex subunit Rav1 [Schizosaccharomyces cryophilus OY26]|uniref:RAVE complex subunit Rav1 n=1 Tax=Schizosaccharomyces cryophilus (strain OY26 / ATCC MYA-4695 / CBS 11777 / NBRC 106824 / NRRL Y48691) TaxID=653667 RepID=S9XJD7_SCHCR|nr:RAVE complex subunit Rav1 [Schizosaccharomyces cryophilus OY26]EPY53766.1 RAVE complex subunit Rav1 [Schizosaccharomyces cryophilus OY26]